LGQHSSSGEIPFTSTQKWRLKKLILTEHEEKKYNSSQPCAATEDMSTLQCRVLDSLPALSLICSMALGNLLNLCAQQFPQPQNRVDYITV
jgi:hypothetical protein